MATIETESLKTLIEMATIEPEPLKSPRGIAFSQVSLTPKYNHLIFL